MTARVLVVDDILANVKLLEAKLTADYFDVFTAMNGYEALEATKRVSPDIVLLDVMMPGMDGFEVCRRLKSDPATSHIPVVMVTALDQPEDRVQGIEAGADDFLTKPVNDVALFARVKSLVRLKTLIDELRNRAATSERMGLIDEVVMGDSKDEGPGRITLVHDDPAGTEWISNVLSPHHEVNHIADPNRALLEAADGNWELLIVSLNLQNYDGLRLCSQLRSLERTRNMPIVILTGQDDTQRLLRGLEIGVNDYLLEPVDPNEMLARLRLQLRRHRYAERLRANVDQSMEMAVTDALTGLYNRRYMEGYLATLLEQALEQNRPVGVMIFDIDHFKAVNDTHGHDVGDVVLQEFAIRIRSSIRGTDLICRQGGEEFVLVLPDSDRRLACIVAERLRQKIAGQPFAENMSCGPLDITASIGVAGVEGPEDTPDAILKRADLALYQAKETGRNKVVADAA